MTIHAHAIPSRTEPTYAYQTYHRLLVVSIVANILVALAMVINPAWVADLIDLGPSQPTVWMRYIGMMILVLTGTYLPLIIAPQAYTFMGFYTGILRLVLVLFFVFAGGGFLWFALYDGLFGILLLVSYYRAYITELMSLP